MQTAVIRPHFDLFSFEGFVMYIVDLFNSKSLSITIEVYNMDLAIKI